MPPRRRNSTNRSRHRDGSIGPDRPSATGALKPVCLRKIAEARTKIEARAKERHAREMAEYQPKLAARDAKTAATDKKPGGKPQQPPTEGPLPRDQINLTDENSRVMPVAEGGFEQCNNARKPPWRREVCWWLLSMWFSPQMTSNSSRRCWVRSAPARRIG